MQRPRPRIGSFLFSLLLLASAIGVVIYRQQLVDWWQLRNYNPSAEVAQLANDAKVTDYARRVFYVTQPAVENSQSFNQHCNRRAEKTIVLGCYDGRHIYIYNVTDSRLAGVKQVTAMHEMLHAAYQRLSVKEKERVNELIEAQRKSSNDPHINELIAQYEKTEPGEIDNELHSIFGTETTELSPELEIYYHKYFNDRKIVVAYSNQYESIFKESQAQIVAIDAQLTQLKARIEDNQATLKNQQDALEAEAARMNELRKAGQIDAYNAAVAPYNLKVQNYNALINETKQLVDQYNALVQERNQRATAHNNLTESLNSNFNPLPAQ